MAKRPDLNYIKISHPNYALFANVRSFAYICDMENQNKVLIYKSADGKTEVEVKLENESVWLTQKQVADLFGTQVPAISKHISNIVEDGELDALSTISKMEIVQKEGNRFVNRTVDHYNLDMIISVGYRVNSHVAVQFRIWATKLLKEYIIKGFAIDDDKLKGSKTNYFDELTERVRSIRTSERNFWLKVTDVFATSIDYDAKAPISQTFFASVQNMFHYAIHGHTAAELILKRVDAHKLNMGLGVWKGRKITKADVQVAKNYLTETELKRLNLLVEQYLSFAELQSLEQRPMYMRDWSEKLKGFFILNDKPILTNAGTVKAEVSKKKAIDEYQKYEKERQEKLGNQKSAKGNDVEDVGYTDV